MLFNQLSIFKKKLFPIIPQPPIMSFKKPLAKTTILNTLPIYFVYLQSGGYSPYTPKQFTGDVKALGLFLREKTLLDIQSQDIQQWVGNLKKLPDKKYTAKTISRKLSAINNYFHWLVSEEVLKKNPAENIRNFRITSPLPDILFESECQTLLTTASTDARVYLLVLLLLETGIKKEELFNLQVQHFDFSNKYAPEVWIKHAGKKVKKDRKLKLPVEVAHVFNEYTSQNTITDYLFPYTHRFIEYLLKNLGQQANIKKKVTASILRDTFAVRQLRRGEGIDFVLTKLGLFPSTWEDAKEKYLKLASRGI
jgi:site-specific recombinase XerD